MLLRHHPTYPWSDYVGDHERVFEAIERRDPRAPDVVRDHLRLSARLIGEELARETADGAGGELPARSAGAGSVT
jgi:DNA-binding GntR family transcriptional regulator